MGRRVDSGDNDVSLFPFLSILACIIGVLTLMISTLALSQMDDKVVVQAEELEQVTAELEKEKLQLVELQNQLKEDKSKFASQATAKQKQLAELNETLSELQTQVLQARNQKKNLDQQNNEDQTPEKQALAELETRLGELKEQIAQLTKQIEDKKLPPEEAQVTVLPGGSGVGVKPRFVECTNNELVLHTPQGQTRVRAGNMENDKDFVQLLDDVAGDDDAKVIFLIRDDGVHVYWRARNFANSLDVANGKLPVLGHGKLNFDPFFKKKK